MIAVKTLEREIIAKFQQLDKDAQQRVREVINRQPTDFDFAAWLRRVDEVRVTLRTATGEPVPFVSDLLDEVRGERDDDGLQPRDY
jgi:hypothetical protein